MRLAAEQIYEKEKISDLMINIFSHIVEFRNGESGPHVLHIRTITEVLLSRLVQKTDRYSLTQEDIQLDFECVRAARYRQGQYSG